MKDLTWTILESEYLYRETWFTIRRDTCVRPDGRVISPYYVYEFPTWVTAVALTKEGQVVLVRQYRHAIGESILEIPGGCVDDTDANLEAAVSRELLEETGYRFDRYEYLGKISPNPSTNNNWMHMFLATGGEKVQQPDLDHNEDIEVHLLSLEELREMVLRNEIVQSLHMTCIFYAFQRLGLWSSQE